MGIQRIVGDNIRFIRQKKGITLDELSVKSKMSRTFISDVERRKKLPSILTIAKIAKVLKVEPAFLLTPNAYRSIEDK
jgi:transcriptional regulator with XRE-family HTH domain